MARIGIYGAGGGGGFLFEVLTKSGIEIDFFIDEFSENKTKLDLPIYRISEISEKDQVKLYVSLNYDWRCGYSLIEDLRNYGFSEVISYNEVAMKYDVMVPLFAKFKVFYMEATSSEMVDEKAIDTFMNILEDTKSKNSLQRLVAFRKKMNRETYPYPDNSVQYLPEDIPDLFAQEKLNIIDCGSFNGDTAIQFSNYFKHRLNSLNSLEPDSTNFKKLCNVTDRLSVELPETDFINLPFGASNDLKTLALDANHTGSSSSNGSKPNAQYDSTNHATFTSLDSAFLNIKPTYIKMDIEGAEQDALHGAERIIRKHKPNLAIAIYHRPDDLWKIPLMIKSMRPDYKMYLRIHGAMGLETILYCV